MESIVDRIGPKLKMHWGSRGVTLNPPASESALQTFESRYAVSLPKDFRDYLLTVNGMAPEASDDELIRFWSIEEIKPLSEEAPEYSGRNYLPDADSVFVFADYSIWAHAYSIRLWRIALEPNTILVIGGSKPIVVADSFLGFAEGYLANNHDILFPKPSKR